MEEQAQTTSSEAKTSPEQQPSPNQGYSWLLMAGHLCSDVNQGALLASLPFLVLYSGFSYTAVSLLILADQSKDIEDMTDEELDAFIDGMTSGEYDSFIDSMTDEEFYRFMDRYYGEGFSDSFDDYLDHKLGDGADVTDPEAEAILGVTSALVIAIIVVMCLLALALSIYCLVVSILILRAKNDPTHFKRYFVMSIVAASLCLVTGSIVSTVLFVLTSVWIYKVRKKAGQIATKAPQPVNPVQ